MFTHKRKKKVESIEGYCSECEENTLFKPESFDYAGTHCNHGFGGVHYTGSICCENCNNNNYEYPNYNI